jgi:cytoskeletal protein RodZ
VQQFKREFRGGRRTPELDMPMPIDDNQLPSWKIIVGVLGALLLFYVLMGLLSPSQQPDPTPTVASTEQPTGNAPPSASEMPAPQMATDTPMTPIGNAVPASGETGSANVAATGIAYGAANATRVTIVAAQDSWVQVRAADGQVVFSRVMRPGDSFRVPDDSNLNLTTGNLSGLHFTIDGKGVTPNGPPGTVLRNLPLSADALGQNLSQISANTNSNVQPQ